MKVVDGRIVREGVLVSCSQAHEMAEIIAKDLNISHIKGELTHLTGGEIKVRPSASISGFDDVFVLQRFDHDIHLALWELFIMMDSLRRGHGKRVYVVIPSLPYARQDAVTAPREAITARMLLDILENVSGMYSLITVMLHSRQTMGFVRGPVDNLTMRNEMAGRLKQTYPQADFSNWFIVAPDSGADREGRKYAELLRARQITLPKIRLSADNVTRSDIPLDTEGRPFAVIDDLLATGGTIESGVRVMDEKGSENAPRALIITHPVFEPNQQHERDSISRINRCGFNAIFISDTIQMPPERLAQLNPKPIIVSSIPVLRVAIECRLLQTPLPDLHKYERS